LLGLFILRDKRDGWTKETRQAYFTALNDGSKFVAGEGMPKFLAQIREQAIATLSDAERHDLAALLESTAESSEPLPPPRPLVKRWTSDDFANLAGDTKRGDPKRGETVFRDALCIRCHRAGARGPAVGPDLTHVAGRFGPRDLLDSILTPNKVIAENYRNVQVRTTDGRSLVGRVFLEGDFRSEKLRLATQPLAPAEIVELDKKQIDEVRESPISPMPEGLLDGFSQQDILDLLAFLKRGGSPSGQ
jgi:putative heme-binding domain-containing protein